MKYFTGFWSSCDKACCRRVKSSRVESEKEREIMQKQPQDKVVAYLSLAEPIGLPAEFADSSTATTTRQILIRTPNEQPASQLASWKSWSSPRSIHQFACLAVCLSRSLRVLVGWMVGWMDGGDRLKAVLIISFFDSSESSSSTPNYRRRRRRRWISTKADCFSKRVGKSLELGGVYLWKRECFFLSWRIT